MHHDAAVLVHAIHGIMLTALIVFCRAWRRGSAFPSLAALRSMTRC